MVLEIDESEKISIDFSSIIYHKDKDFHDELNQINMKLKKINMKLKDSLLLDFCV